nr:MAG TPA: hypothetical protein [Caudoviricetes sp.]
MALGLCGSGGGCGAGDTGDEHGVLRIEEGVALVV